MRCVQYIVLLLWTLALASCSSDSFKIDGNIAHIEGDGVAIVFQGDSGIVDEWINLDQKGRFSFKGEAANPVVVSIMTKRGEPLVTVVAANGDHLKVKGDATRTMAIKVKGNDVNEDWQLFRDEHAAFYTDPNPSRLDAAIEKYVREHPTDMLSTVLLMADYSNYTDQGKINKMLQGIDAQARPASLVKHFTGRQVARNTHLPRLMSLKLVKGTDQFEEISLTGHITLINLWAFPQEDRNALIQQLGTLSDQVNVLDVLTESDTLRWHQTIASDPKHWKHYWAPGGPLEMGIQLLGITSMPWFAVTDSTGMVTYSGPDITTAIHSACTTFAGGNE